MARFTTEQWINKAKSVHGDKYDYSISKYTHSKDKISILCYIHGEFKQVAGQHLIGYGCKRCSEEGRRTSHDDYVKKAKKAHDNKYEYVKDSYIGGTHKVKVICPTHGEFSVSAKDHLALKTGCKKCASEKLRNTTKYFIEKAIKVHGDTYIYENTKYSKSNEHVCITCRKHGDFEQIAQYHLQGAGCPSCSIESTGWTYSKWKEQAERSARFNSYKVYILKCYNDDEVFFKVGKTFLTVAQRYQGATNMPYEYEVIKVIEGSAKHISELEHSIHSASADFRYNPKISFGGETECFDKVIIPGRSEDTVVDNPICRMESFRNLTSNDAWAAGAGYRGVKQAVAITYSDMYGEIARNTVNIAEVENAKR